jgi:hypothetical protein
MSNIPHSLREGKLVQALDPKGSAMLFDRHQRLADRSNRRSHVGGARRDRTDDLLNANQALSQLSYGPILGEAKNGCSWPQAPAWTSVHLAIRATRRDAQSRFRRFAPQMVWNQAASRHPPPKRITPRQRHQAERPPRPMARKA